MQIIPAILEKNIEDFQKNINSLSSTFLRFQIDVCDGEFVNNKTFDIIDLSKLNINKNIVFDFHLMTNNCIQEIEKVNSLNNINTNIIFIPIKKNEEIKNTNFSKIGFVFNPEENIFDYKNMLNKVKHIQIMSVIPGFQGSKFIPNTLNKINDLKKLNFPGQIYLDGGINDKTIPLIQKNENLPDFLCIGSYLKTLNKSSIESIPSLFKSNGNIDLNLT